MASTCVCLSLPTRATGSARCACVDTCALVCVCVCVRVCVRVCVCVPLPHSPLSPLGVVLLTRVRVLTIRAPGPLSSAADKPPGNRPPTSALANALRPSCVHTHTHTHTAHMGGSDACHTTHTRAYMHTHTDSCCVASLRVQTHRIAQCAQDAPSMLASEMPHTHRCEGASISHTATSHGH